MGRGGREFHWNSAILSSRGATGYNSHRDVDDLVDLPDFDEESDEDADSDDEVGLVIEDVE